MELLEKRWAANVIGACSAVVLYLLLTHLTGTVVDSIRSFLHAISPILIGLAIAYLVDPLTQRLEKTLLKNISKGSWRRALSVSIAMTCVLLILGFLIYLIIPAIIDSIKTLVNNTDQYTAVAQALLNKLGINLESESFISTLNEALDDLSKALKDNLGTILSGLSSIGSFLANLFIGIILAIYFLLDKNNLMNGLDKFRRAAMVVEKYDRHTVFWNRCNVIFQQYILYSLLDAAIIGIANAVFMLIMGMPYVPLVSILIAMTNLLPTFGPIIGGITGALIMLLASPSDAIAFLIFTLILQTIDGNIIKPRLFHNSLGLPPVWTLIAIIIAGKLFGVLGIFLAIPFMVVLRLVYHENFLIWLQRRTNERSLKAKESDQ